MQMLDLGLEKPIRFQGQKSLDKTSAEAKIGPIMGCPGFLSERKPVVLEGVAKTENYRQIGKLYIWNKNCLPSKRE